MAVAESEHGAPTVTEPELKELAATALRIENYMKCVQDIEWAVDSEGRLFILQTRPLRIDTPRTPANLGAGIDEQVPGGCGTRERLPAGA